MKPCPNCQQPVPLNATFCSNCGYILTPAVKETRMTGMPWLDVFLGVLAALISPFLFGVGIIVALALCVVLWRTYSYFARGLLAGLIVWAVLLLGALALCFGMIAMAK